MTARQISNSDDTIDSRDVIERIEELEELETAVTDAREDLETNGAQLTELEAEEEPNAEEIAKAVEVVNKAQEDLDAAELAFDEEDQQELKALRSLQEEAEGYCEDWRHGAQLIRDSYFVEAMQELCDDIGDLPKNLPSYIEIDWERTASNLQTDYTSVEFDGVTYWVR